MNKRTPSVAVVIAAYNSAATIGRAVKSALAEPETAEVIVVDDASTDATAACARAADDGSRRLKILTQTLNMGPAAARNRAINESRAPWVGALDDDDYFMPGRLKTLLANAQDADFVADNMLRLDESDPSALPTLLFGKELAEPIWVNFEKFVLSNVTRRKRPRGEMGFIKPLMRRSFLDAHSLRYQEHMRLGEDYDLYARALAFGARFRLLPTPGYMAITRANSLSGKHAETDLMHLRACDLELMQWPGLTARDKAALRHHCLSIDQRLQWRKLINAVKKRSAREAFTTFARPFPVPFYLAAKLAEQLILRSLGSARRILPKNS